MLKRALIAAVVLAGSWWGMMATHELGHIIGAVLTGGHVQHVELRPWHFSRTDVDPNPHPGIVVWCGPVTGVALPVLIRLCRRRWHILRFFAGFCLIVNGAYIGSGVVTHTGDTYMMHLTGTPDWLMGLFGATCLACGLWLWHKLDALTLHQRA